MLKRSFADFGIPRGKSLNLARAAEKMIKPPAKRPNIIYESPAD
jgi:hypothetical protein